MELTKDNLDQLLREAEKAHGEFEKASGKRDENWPAWYAEFIINKIKQ